MNEINEAQIEDLDNTVQLVNDLFWTDFGLAHWLLAQWILTAIILLAVPQIRWAVTLIPKMLINISKTAISYTIEEVKEKAEKIIDESPYGIFEGLDNEWNVTSRGIYKTEKEPCNEQKINFPVTTNK